MSDRLAAATAAGDPPVLPSVAASAPPPLVFRRDADEFSFPVGGAILLLALLAVAVWAWTLGRRAPGRRPRGLAGPWRLPGTAAAEDGQRLSVVASTRLDLGARLHVVQWHGEQVLVAVNGTAAPVLLSRRRADGVFEPSISQETA